MLEAERDLVATCHAFGLKAAYGEEDKIFIRIVQHTYIIVQIYYFAIFARFLIFLKLRISFDFYLVIIYEYKIKA